MGSIGCRMELRSRYAVLPARPLKLPERNKTRLEVKPSPKREAKRNRARKDRTPDRRIQDESFAALYSSPDRNFAAHGGDPARRSCCFLSIACIGVAASRLPDDPGGYLLSRC